MQWEKEVAKLDDTKPVTKEDLQNIFNLIST